MTSFTPHSLPPRLIQMMGDIEANLASRARQLAGRVEALGGHACVHDPLGDHSRPLEIGDHLAFETTIGCERPEDHLDIEFNHGAHLRIEGATPVALSGWFPGQVGIRPEVAVPGRLTLSASAHSGLSILLMEGQVRLSTGSLVLEIHHDQSCHITLRAGQAMWIDSSNRSARIVARRKIIIRPDGTAAPAQRPSPISWRMTSLGVAAVLVAAMAMHIGHSLGSGSAQGVSILATGPLTSAEPTVLAMPGSNAAPTAIPDRPVRPAAPTTATALEPADAPVPTARTQASATTTRRAAPTTVTAPRAFSEPHLPEEYILWQSLHPSFHDVASAGTERTFRTSAVRQPQPAMAGETPSGPARRQASEVSPAPASEAVMTGTTLPADRAIPAPDDFIGGDMIHFFVK